MRWCTFLGQRTLQLWPTILKCHNRACFLFILVLSWITLQIFTLSCDSNIIIYWLNQNADCLGLTAVFYFSPKFWKLIIFLLEEACIALLPPSYASVQGEGMVFSRGPYQLHNWSSVLHTIQTRGCCNSLQTDPDQWQQADSDTTGRLSQRIFICLQGNYNL